MVDAAQVVFIGLGTGFGSAMGTDFARFLVNTIKEQRNERKALKFET